MIRVSGEVPPAGHEAAARCASRSRREPAATIDRARGDRGAPRPTGPASAGQSRASGPRGRISGYSGAGGCVVGVVRRDGRRRVPSSSAASARWWVVAGRVVRGGRRDRSAAARATRRSGAGSSGDGRLLGRVAACASCRGYVAGRGGRVRVGHGAPRRRCRRGRGADPPSTSIAGLRRGVSLGPSSQRPAPTGRSARPRRSAAASGAPVAAAAAGAPRPSRAAYRRRRGPSSGPALVASGCWASRRRVRGRGMHPTAGPPRVGAAAGRPRGLRRSRRPGRSAAASRRAAAPAARPPRPARPRRPRGRTGLAHRAAGALDAGDRRAGGESRHARAGRSASAAPLAIAFFGSASTATGRPSCSETSWATSGIRDEPPTSSTAESCVGRQPGRADRAAQRLHRLLDPRPDHRLELAAVQPHRPLGGRQSAPGSTPRCRCSAPPWPRCTRAAPRPPPPAPPVGVVEARRTPPAARPGRARTPTSSKSTPPSRSSPPGRPEQRRTRWRVLVHDRRVERAAAQVVHRDRGAGLDPLRRRVVQRRGLRLGQERDRDALPGAAPRASRSFLCGAPRGRVGDRDPVGRAALALGDPVDDPAHQPGATAPPAPTARPPTTIGVGSPIRRLNSRTTRSGSVGARRSAASPTSTEPSSPT